MNDNLNRFIDAKCPICKKIPGSPVEFSALACECKHTQVYCMSCLRDASGINTTDLIPLTECPTCSTPFVIEGNRNAKNTYTPLPLLARLYDRTYGKITCPRKCAWIGFRSELSKHSNICLNSRRMCNQCRMTFTLATIKAHTQSCGMDSTISGLDI